MINLVILQARMSSTRLPGKVMEIVNDSPMIWWQIQRIIGSKANKIVLATSNEYSDDALVEFATSAGIEVYRGDLNDVFSRFEGVINDSPSQNFIRLTADCPLVMPMLIDSMIEYYDQNSFDYLSNTLTPPYPDGLDIEIVRTSAFQRLSQCDLTQQEREHVTLGMYSRPNEFVCSNFPNSTNLSDLRWTVDYPEDLAFIRRVYSNFKGKETTFGIEDVLELLDSEGFMDNKMPSEYRNIALQGERYKRND
jgi:spore coat polysaccharide biosynthesis protein SpsF